jgi:septal ring factor EnvC (AmiA/AmiB activator)
MSDDIVARLRATGDDWPACLLELEYEAADEIKKLRAELAATRSTLNDLHERQMKLVADCNQARAELAAANAEIARLRADNEKQRERVKKWVNEAMRHEKYDDDQ